MQAKVNFPKDSKAISKEVRDLLKNLLQVDITRRFGNMHGGVNDVKDHPFFAGLDWFAIFDMSVLAPYVPPYLGPGDASNFEKFVQYFNFIILFKRSNTFSHFYFV